MSADPAPACVTVRVYPQASGFLAVCQHDECRWIGGSQTFAMAALRGERHVCRPALNAPYSQDGDA